MMSPDRTQVMDGEPVGEWPRDAVPLVGCEQIQGVLLDYLGRELGSHAAILVREHLRHCRACQAEFLALARMMEHLRSGDPARSAPGVLSDRRRRKVAWTWTHPVLAWCVRQHQRISFAMALIVLLAVFFALRHWRMNTPPPEGYPVRMLQDSRSSENTVRIRR